VRHWRRRLKDGRLEFFFQTDRATVGGAAAVDVVDYLQLRFERVHGVVLPSPEWKRPRFKT
jgi:hypothetical protein